MIRCLVFCFVVLQIYNEKLSTRFCLEKFMTPFFYRTQAKRRMSHLEQVALLQSPNCEKRHKTLFAKVR